MTPEQEVQCREAFEKWAIERGYNLTRIACEENYYDPSTFYLWKAWQAREQEVQQLRDALSRICSRLPFGDMPAYVCATQMQEIAKQALAAGKEG